MKKSMCVAYVATLVAYLILDGLWLGIIAKESYTTAMAELLRDRDFPRWPWVTFYMMYSFVIVYLVIKPNLQQKAKTPVFVAGALLGLASYGAYNLTNIAIIEGWPLAISVKDWAWGVFVTSSTGGAGWFAARLLQKNK